MYIYGPFFRTQCGINVHKHLKTSKAGRAEMLGCKVNDKQAAFFGGGDWGGGSLVLLLLNIVQMKCALRITN